VGGRARRRRRQGKGGGKVSTSRQLYGSGGTGVTEPTPGEREAGLDSAGSPIACSLGWIHLIPLAGSRARLTKLGQGGD
jgi:hypothetical protein